MARKGNQQKNGVDHQSSNHKKRDSDTGCAMLDTRGRGREREFKIFPGEEFLNGDHTSNPLTEKVTKTSSPQDEKKSRQKPGKVMRKGQHGSEAVEGLEQPAFSESSVGGCTENIYLSRDSSASEVNETSASCNFDAGRINGSFSHLLNGLSLKNIMENMVFSHNGVVESLRASILSIGKVAGDWFEGQKPSIFTLRNRIMWACDYVRRKTEPTYVVLMKWVMHFGSLMLLLSMVWLDCALRGIDSFLRMGTTSFFSVIWCSILSVVAMVGMSSFLVVLALAAAIGVFVGITLGILVAVVAGTVLLWFYGSFWTTTFMMLIAGLAFLLTHERLALLITTVYSLYCAWAYVGWLGVLLGFNLSFISSDALIFFLKNYVSQNGRSSRPFEQTAGMQGQSGFKGENASSFEAGPGFSTDRGPGVPSTSGCESETTSEDEVIRLLNCTDHYSVLGLSRYENVDVSILKREYRKKAMLVHPDKNMGNEKAAEAFKKLQNAYEVLLDSLKRKAYDDELRREELLNYFRRFQSTSQKKGGHGFFSSGFARSEAEGEDPFGDSRRIACKRCSGFHIWILTRKSKSRARWCQDCKDFHQAKDGDGWVEQSSQPIFFGILQKVDAPRAYVSADSKIYDVTEWYICQGMRCVSNTHKPSFHVNTSIPSKHGSNKGTSSGQRGGWVPPFNVEEGMTEDEFFDWLQNAMQAGMFDNHSSPSASENAAKAANGAKSSGSSGGKRKKKGKKPW